MKKTQRLLLILSLLGCLSTIMVGAVGAADFAIIVKSGTLDLWDKDQHLDQADRQFDHQSQRTLSVAWEVRNSQELALGMEYFTFRHGFTPPVTGHTKSEILQFTVKKYFSPNRVLHPYAGMGLGWGYAKFDDGEGNVDRDVNFALHAAAGVEFRLGDNFGLYTEVKGLASGTDSEDDNEFDFSGTGFLAGISLIF